MDVHGGTLEIGSSLSAEEVRIDYGATHTDNMGEGFGVGVQFQIQDDTNLVKAAEVVGVVRESTSDDETALFFRTRNSAEGTVERMRINSEGKVGIGTSDPQGLLHVQGTSNDVVLIRGTNSVPKLHFRRTTSGIDWVLRHETAVPSKFHFQTELSDGHEVLTLVSDGKVGIDTTAPARKLHVKDVLRLEPRSSAPSSPSAGDMYFSSTVNKLMVYDGSTWQACW